MKKDHGYISIRNEENSSVDKRRGKARKGEGREER